MQVLKQISSSVMAVAVFAASLMMPSKTTLAQSSDDNTILGAGSTFVNPLFSKLFYVYHEKNGLQVNYQSVGSGAGISQLTAKTVDFGDSDGPMNDEQTKKA